MIQLRHNAREIENQFFGPWFSPGRYVLAGASLDQGSGPADEPMVVYVAGGHHGDEDRSVTVRASVVLDSLSHITGARLTNVEYDGSQVVYTVEPV